MPSSAVPFENFDQLLINTIIGQLREAKSGTATTPREKEDLRVHIVRCKQTLMDLLYVKAVSGSSPAYF